MKAIILAAGVGSRLQSVLKGRPKPLLELEGKSLLEYSLEALAANKIDEVNLAIGFEGERIREKIGTSFMGMEIRYSRNERYDSSGSMHSLYQALGTAQNCLVLDGDIVYSPQAIAQLLKSKDKDSVILTDCCGSGDEVYVTLDKGDVAYLGKKLPAEKDKWEFTGISRFSKAFVSQMFRLHEENMSRGDYSEYYEDCAYRTSKLMPWKGLAIKGLAWSEVDKKEDIPRALGVLKAITASKKS